MEGNTCFGSVKEVTDYGPLISVFQGCGSMEKKEGGVVWNRTFREFLHDLADISPKVYNLEA